MDVLCVSCTLNVLFSCLTSCICCSVLLFVLVLLLVFLVGCVVWLWLFLGVCFKTAYLQINRIKEQTVGKIKPPHYKPIQSNFNGLNPDNSFTLPE